MERFSERREKEDLRERRRGRTKMRGKEEEERDANGDYAGGRSVVAVPALMMEREHKKRRLLRRSVDGVREQREAITEELTAFVGDDRCRSSSKKRKVSNPLGEQDLPGEAHRSNCC